jgi:hypothetical protein
MIRQKPRLIQQVKDTIRLKRYSFRTEKSYVLWVKRYIKFHDLQLPKDLGAGHINQFLTLCLYRTGHSYAF